MQARLPMAAVRTITVTRKARWGCFQPTMRNNMRESEIRAIIVAKMFGVIVSVAHFAASIAVGPLRYILCVPMPFFRARDSKTKTTRANTCTKV